MHYNVGVYLLHYHYLYLFVLFYLAFEVVILSVLFLHSY